MRLCVCASARYTTSKSKSKSTSTSWRFSSNGLGRKWFTVLGVHVVLPSCARGFTTKYDQVINTRVCASVQLCVCASVHLCVCAAVRLCVRVSVRMRVYPSARQRLNPSMHLCVCACDSRKAATDPQLTQLTPQLIPR